MSIETEFESTITNVKNAYQGLDNLGATIPQNKTIENIKDCLDEIYNNLPKTSYAEGSNITLSNTLKGKLDFEDGIVGYGDTEQDTTEGKNVYNPTLTYEGTTIRQTNCSITLNEDELTFVASGTDMRFGDVIPTGTAFSDAFGYLITIPSNATNVYLLTTNNQFDKNFVCFYDENKVSLGFESITTSKTITSGAKYCNFRIGKGGSVADTTYKTKIMVSFESITSYEPYTGGQASPSPSYPQEIEVVTGTQTVYIKDKNNNIIDTKTINLGEYEFAKIGNYVDTIEYDVDEDKVYKNENIVKQVVTGTFLDNLYTFMVQSINSYGIANFLLQYISNSEEALYGFAGLCNYLSTQTSLIANEQNEGILYQQIAVYIRIKSTTASTTTEFKTYVNSLNTGGNPLIIYRQLLTPTKIEITGTLKDQIKALYNSHSFTGTTIIEIDGQLPLIIKVRALKGE